MKKYLIYVALVMILTGCTNSEEYIKNMSATITNSIESVTKFDSSGYDKDGYNRDGFNRYGYNREGYNRNGYNKEGYDKNGFDEFGYNKEGYDKGGYNRLGWSREGIHKETGTNYGPYGLDVEGYSREGYSFSGYDREGYDREGYNNKGYDRNGYDRWGWNRDMNKHSSGITEQKHVKVTAFSKSLFQEGYNTYQITNFKIDGKRVNARNKVLEYKMEIGKEHRFTYTVNMNGASYDMDYTYGYPNLYTWASRTGDKELKLEVWMELEK